MSNFIFSLLLKNIFSEGELGEPATTGQFRQWVAAGGDRALGKYLQYSGVTVHMTPHPDSNPDKVSGYGSAAPMWHRIPPSFPPTSRDSGLVRGGT